MRRYHCDRCGHEVINGGMLNSACPECGDAMREMGSPTRAAGMDDPHEVPAPLKLKMFARKWKYTVVYLGPVGLWCRKTFRTWKAVKKFCFGQHPLNVERVEKQEQLIYVREIKPPVFHGCSGCQGRGCGRCSG